VVKVGTSLLTDSDNHVDPAKIKRVATQIAALRKSGREAILVTSGAVGIGLGIIGSSNYPKKLDERQALAAMGQSRLMHMYEDCFRRHGCAIGQVLLTAEDIHVRERALNVRHTLNKLFEFKAIPIVNENDTVSTEELKTSIGDNDSLSAYVALAADADLLVILTDTDGLYDKNPKSDPLAKRIALVRGIDDTIISLAKGTDKITAIGGMQTKISAARMAVEAGIAVVIASGSDEHTLESIIAGKDIGTLFVPSRRKDKI